jgi:WhiB family redox-sensing transcriptional regulator
MGDDVSGVTDSTPIARPSIQGALVGSDLGNRAACLDEHPEFFFPIGNGSSALLQIEKAKAVCRRCEVVGACVKWAMEPGQHAGVWGRLSQDERHAVQRRNARAHRAS